MRIPPPALLCPLLIAACLGAGLRETRDAGEERQTLVHDGRERSYVLHIPKDLPPGPAPVVLVFHGGGGNGAQIATHTQFRALADRGHFIAVFPDALNHHWNDGRSADASPSHKEKVDDLGFIADILKTLPARHAVDPKRVYATGISNGGIFSHYLAANRADLIAAIAPVAGGVAEPFSAKFAPTAPVSVLAINGTDDPLVPYAGGGVDKGKRGRVIATDDAMALWAKQDLCEAKAVEIDLEDRDPRDGCTARQLTWGKGKDGAEVRLIRIKGGGHTWPGASQYLPKVLIGPVCRDFDATEVIWEFFKGHPKR